jgi:hypothetical protein
MNQAHTEILRFELDLPVASRNPCGNDCSLASGLAMYRTTKSRTGRQIKRAAKSETRSAIKGGN